MKKKFLLGLSVFLAVLLTCSSWISASFSDPDIFMMDPSSFTNSDSLFYMNKAGGESFNISAFCGDKGNFFDPGIHMNLKFAVTSTGKSDFFIPWKLVGPSQGFNYTEAECRKYVQYILMTSPSIISLEQFNKFYDFNFTNIIDANKVSQIALWSFLNGIHIDKMSLEANEVHLRAAAKKVISMAKDPSLYIPPTAKLTGEANYDNVSTIGPFTVEISNTMYTGEPFNLVWNNDIQGIIVKVNGTPVANGAEVFDGDKITVESSNFLAIKTFTLSLTSKFNYLTDYHILSLRPLDQHGNIYNTVQSFISIVPTFDKVRASIKITFEEVPSSEPAPSSSETPSSSEEASSCPGSSSEVPSSQPPSSCPESSSQPPSSCPESSSEAPPSSDPCSSKPPPPPPSDPCSSKTPPPPPSDPCSSKPPPPPSDPCSSKPPSSQPESVVDPPPPPPASSSSQPESVVDPPPPPPASSSSQPESVVDPPPPPPPASSSSQPESVVDPPPASSNDPISSTEPASSCPPASSHQDVSFPPASSQVTVSTISTPDPTPSTPAGGGGDDPIPQTGYGSEGSNPFGTLIIILLISGIGTACLAVFRRKYLVK